MNINARLFQPIIDPELTIPEVTILDRMSAIKELNDVVVGTRKFVINSQKYAYTIQCITYNLSQMKLINDPIYNLVSNYYQDISMNKYYIDAIIPYLERRIDNNTLDVNEISEFISFVSNLDNSTKIHLNNLNQITTMMINMTSNTNLFSSLSLFS